MIQLDFLYLPGKKAQRYYINEGLLSTLPAIALSLFGVLTGLLFKNASVEPRKKITWLVVAGLGCIALGLLWSVSFPLIKRIWASSFILVAGGCSALLMALFYWLVEVRQWRGWCQPFVWVGCNALTIYLAHAIVGFQALATRFTDGDVRQFLDNHVAKGFGALVTACAESEARVSTRIWLAAAKAVGVRQYRVGQGQSPDAMASTAQSIVYLSKLC